LRRGFPIRTSADQRSLASPRGFSQRATSFIASWRQGIHRTPFSCSLTHPTPPARRTKPRREFPLPPAWASARPAPALLMPQPTSHISDKSSHPAAPSPRPPGRTIHPPDPIHRLKEHARPRPMARAGIPCEGSREPSQGPPRPSHMETTGFEPVTPCLQSRCSTS
jgi:hypothetical protein